MDESRYSGPDNASVLRGKFKRKRIPLQNLRREQSRAQCSYELRTSYPKDTCQYVFDIFVIIRLKKFARAYDFELLKSSLLGVPSPPTAPLEIRQIAANTVVISWGRPDSDGGAPLEGYKVAIRDTKRTMWMEVARVTTEIQKLNIRDLQENHMYLIRIFARNEIGLSDPLESEEPFKIIPASELTVVEPIAEATEKGETASISFSTENTSSWLREHNMDADIHSYARARLLRQDEYFFRIWHYAKKLFE